MPNDEGVTTLLLRLAIRNKATVEGTDAVIPIDRSKPLTLSAVILVDAVEPGVMLRLDGEAASEKSRKAWEPSDS